MIYLDLFLGFLKVGFFSFGGAYSAVPLIRDVVLSYGWLTDETLSYMIAVSESTPGPIMVNLATYVGSSQAGLVGSLIATFTVAIPSFVIILLLMVLFKALLKNRYFQLILGGLKPCIIGIIMAVGAYMVISNVLNMESGVADVKAVMITGMLAAIMFLPGILQRKSISPILLIGISAVLGVVFYGWA